MLENAGANVFTPRERDTQKQEVIVDNDGSLSGHGGQGSLYLDVKAGKHVGNRPSDPDLPNGNESIRTMKTLSSPARHALPN